MTLARALPVLVLLSCDGPIELPATPVDEDRTPVIDEIGPLARWGGEPLELKGRHLGQVGERVRVTFTGGAEAGADQLGLGETLTVEVPPDAEDGPVRVITAAGQAESAQSLDFLGADRLLQGSITAEVDLRLSLRAVYDIGTDGDVAVVHGDRGLRVHVDGTTDGYPRPLTFLSGDRPVFADPASPECGGRPSLVIWTAALEIESETCLPEDGGEVDAWAASVTADERWLLVAREPGRLWRVDLGPEQPVATVHLMPEVDASSGMVALAGHEFVLVGFFALWRFDAETGALEELARPDVGSPRLVAVAAVGSLLAAVESADNVFLFDTSTRPATLQRTLSSQHTTFTSSSRVYLASDTRSVAVVNRAGVYFWDLTRTRNGPTNYLELEGAAGVTESRDGHSLYVAAMGGYGVVDRETTALVHFERVGSRPGSIRVRPTPTGFDLVVSRIGARDVQVLDGESLAARTVPISDEPVAIELEPDSDVVWALGVRGLWKVSATGSVGWISAPDGATAVDLIRQPWDGRLVIAWQTVDEVIVEWIDPTLPSDERVLGWASLGGSDLFQLTLVGQRVVAFSLNDVVGSSEVFVDIFDGAGVVPGEAPPRAGTLSVAFFGGLLQVGERLLLYDGDFGASTTSGVWVDPAAVTTEFVTGLPFIGVDAAASSSGRLLVWRDGGSLGLRNRLITMGVDPITLARVRPGPIVPIDAGFRPRLVLPEGDGVVLVNLSGDRMQIVR